jgi:ribokinase
MIVCFGSINLDLIFAVDHLPRAGETVLGPSMRIEPGGKGANQAVAAARDGAAVVFAGAVGADALAEDALTLLQGHTDVTRVIKAPTASGCAAICVDAQGRNLIAVASGANLFARATQIEDALLGPGTTVLLQREVDPGEIETLIRRARAGGARIVLNLAPAGALAVEALRALDVLVLNEDEAGWLAHHLGSAEGAVGLHDTLGVDVVVTLGEAGVAIAGRAGVTRLPAHPVTAVDTTGAGDCFTGVLAAGLDRGLTLEAAARRANAAAGLCCTRAGTQGSMPEAAETNAALQEWNRQAITTTL